MHVFYYFPFSSKLESYCGFSNLFVYLPIYLFIYLFIESHCSKILGVLLINLFPFWPRATTSILIPSVSGVLPCALVLHLLPWWYNVHETIAIMFLIFFLWPVSCDCYCLPYCVIPKCKSSILFTVFVPNIMACNQLCTYPNNKR